jgi:hypothetical protein
MRDSARELLIFRAEVSLYAQTQARKDPAR